MQVGRGGWVPGKYGALLRWGPPQPETVKHQQTATLLSSNNIGASIIGIVFFFLGGGGGADIKGPLVDSEPLHNAFWA